MLPQFRDQVARDEVPYISADEMDDEGDPGVMDLDACLDEWFKKRVPSLRENTRSLYKSQIENHWRGKFKGIAVESVTARSWLRVLDAMTPTVATASLKTVKACLRWCQGRLLIEGARVLDISPTFIGAAPKTGDRVLTLKELADAWNTVERSRAGVGKYCVLFTMLFACRPREAMTLEWVDLDFDSNVWTVPASKSKTNKPIRRPIYPEAEQFLTMMKRIFSYSEDRYRKNSSDYVFPGYRSGHISTTALQRLVARSRVKMNCPYWRLHDIRRTLSTRLSEKEVDIHVTERMLGHDLGGILAVYNKHDWLDAQMDAYSLWIKLVFGEAP